MKFYIKGKMPSLNDVIEKTRINKFAGATMKRKLQQDIRHQILQQIAVMSLEIPLDCQCDFKFTFYEQNKKRDKDNIISSQKFLFDAMVEVGLIKNDGWRWVRNLAYDFKIDSEYMVEIEITEI